MKESVLTERINKKLIEHGIPKPFRELRLCLPEGRQFRADYCWLNYKCLVGCSEILVKLKYELKDYSELTRFITKGKPTLSKLRSLVTEKELKLANYIQSLDGVNGIVLEADGKPFGGRHTRGAGFIQDSEKKNMISGKGFIVLNTTGKDLDGLMEVIKKCLKRI